MNVMTTIRVPKRIRDRVKALAECEGVSMATAIEQALEAKEAEQFWADMASAAANDPIGLSRESEPWANTFKDGLVKEGWSHLE